MKKLAKVRVQIIDQETKLPKEDVDVITSADAVYFPDGKTFQEKWENGDFQGVPGDDGKAATVRVGETITLDAGSKAKVENIGTMSSAVLNFLIPKGEKGDPGTSIKIISKFNSYAELVTIYPDGSSIDGGFLIGTNNENNEYYYWDFNRKQWMSAGPLRGEKGPQGIKGEPGDNGKGLSIFTFVENYAELIEKYPDGSICNGQGVITLDTKEYWFWDMVRLKWDTIGTITGEKGDTGRAGTVTIKNVFTVGPDAKASVYNSGTDTDAILDFYIPQGEKGESIKIDTELNKNSDNAIANSSVFKKLQEYALQNHNHLYAGSDNPGGAANTALECTGNSATATGDADGNEISKTYVAEIINGNNTIQFLSKSGEILFELNKSETYNLPAATYDTLGGIKLGDGMSISNGKLITRNVKLISSGQVSGDGYDGCKATLSCPVDVPGCIAIIIKTQARAPSVTGAPNYEHFVYSTTIASQYISSGSSISVTNKTSYATGVSTVGILYTLIG